MLVKASLAPKPLGRRSLRTVTAFLLWLFTSIGVLGAVDNAVLMDYLNRVNPPRDKYDYSLTYYVTYYYPVYYDEMLLLARGEVGHHPPFDAAAKALTAVGEHDPRFNFEKMRDLIEGVEADALKDPSLVLHLIPFYTIMAWSNRPEALEFLKQRASFEYWQTHPLPHTLRENSETKELWPVTAQSQVMYALARCPRPEAEAFLKACWADPRYHNEPAMEGSVAGSMNDITSWRYDYQMAQDAWAKRGPLTSLTEAPSRPAEIYNPYHFESGLYPPFPLGAKIMIGVIFISLSWWFWHEWKTWPK